jgi:predicted peroxiredoxin
MERPQHGEPAPQIELQVVATSGPNDLPRAALALETALASVASGLVVEVFLVLEASKWACEPRRKTGARIYDLLDQLGAMGARITCCSACVTEHCDPKRWRQMPTRDPVPSVAVTSTGAASTAVVNEAMVQRGLTAFVEGVVRGIPTITI